MADCSGIWTAFPPTPCGVNHVQMRAPWSERSAAIRQEGRERVSIRSMLTLHREQAYTLALGYCRPGAMPQLVTMVLHSKMIYR